MSSDPFYEAVADESPGTTPGGIYADILSYSPFVAATSANGVGDFSSAWVSIQQSNVNWLQVGWTESPGSVRNTFYQTGLNGSPSMTMNFAPTAINSTHRYTATYAPTGADHFKVQLDSDTPLFIPLSWVPDTVFMGVETHDQASQFPGGFDNAEALSNGHIWPVAGTGSSWQDLSADTFSLAFNVVNQNKPSWLNYQPFEASGMDFLDTWDSACGA